MPDLEILTLTVRLYDPKEKKNATLAASWVVIQVPRADRERLLEHLRDLGYPFVEETANPAYRTFLAG